MKRAAIFVAVAFATLPFSTASAQSYVPIENRLTQEQREATGLATLSADQLRLLNQILSGAEVQREKERATQREIAAEREATLLETLDGRPIKAQVKGTFAAWEPGTVIELDNGQRWKVMKGYGKLHKPQTNLEIRVVPGVAGRWFMEFDENRPKARVYRID